MLYGIGVPGGVAVGAAHVGRPPVRTIVERSLAAGEAVAEVARYRRALASAQRVLRRLRGQVPRRTPADIRAFLDAHLLMLRDPALGDAVTTHIRTRRCNAEWALALQRDALLTAFDAIADPYLRARREDVVHVVERILASLDGAEDGTGEQPLDGAIHVSASLGPADVMHLHQRGAAGFVSETGGRLSHAAIIARSLRIPAVLGVRDACMLLRSGDLVAVDGDDGLVVVAPEPAAVAHFRARRRADDRRRGALRALRDRPSVTRDGVVLELLANIEQPADLRAARAAGAAGVGMYRTEPLFMNRDAPPDEDEQYAAYAKAVDGMRGLPVTIRTLDLGADRAVPGRVAAENPALGLRAIRLGLREPHWLMPQLRALLRAAVRGPLEVMVPMVSSVSEIVQFRALLERARVELDAARIRHGPVRIGAMVEVPGAALTAAQLARRVDFLALGTNDLIQYTLAVDRDNDDVNHLYDPLHPAVLKLVAGVLNAGRRAGVPVSLCGEMAGDRRYARLLVGLGLTRFSMHTSHLLDVKEALASADAAGARRLALRMLACRDASRAAELLDELNRT